MQSVIVYRNPLEAMMWESLMTSNVLWPIICGIVVFFALFLASNYLLEKSFKWRYANRYVMVDLIICATVGVAVVAYMIHG